MRPGFLVPSKCRLPECIRLIFPVPVILKRLRAPRCVFNFFFGFVEFRGIPLLPLVYLECGGLTPLFRPRPRTKDRAQNLPGISIFLGCRTVRHCRTLRAAAKRAVLWVGAPAPTLSAWLPVGFSP